MKRTLMSLARVGSFRKAGKVILALGALLLLVGTALANGTPAIDRYVIGGGGGHSEADPYELCAGFWCGMGKYKVYLPLILRDS
jgi:hypothetical protein